MSYELRATSSDTPAVSSTSWRTFSAMCFAPTSLKTNIFLKERRVAAKIDADVTILFVGSFVEQWPVPSHAHQLWTSRPARVKLC